MDIRDLVVRMGYITKEELESLETQLQGSQTLLELLVENGVITTQDVKLIVREANVKDSDLQALLGVALFTAMATAQPLQNLQAITTTLNQPDTLLPSLERLERLEELQTIKTTLEIASDEEIRVLLETDQYNDIVLTREERFDLERDGWTTLISSNVKAARIVKEDNLQIMFHSNNSIYQWNNRASDFGGLIIAPSHGRYVWDNLYGLHTLRVR